MTDRSSRLHTSPAHVLAAPASGRRRTRQWIITLTAAVLLGIGAIMWTTSRGEVEGLGAAATTLSATCLTAPSAVAAGPQGTLFVVDSVGKRDRIVQFSPGGSVLASIEDTSSTVTTDTHGALYYVKHGYLSELLPNKQRRTRWWVGSVDALAVDRHGSVFAEETLATGDQSVIRKFARTGKLLARWRTPYGGAIAVDRNGDLYLQDATRGLAKVDPTTGRALRTHWANPASLSYDALASDARGMIYVGDTSKGDVPFRILELSHAGSTVLQFAVLNTADEMVGALAVDSHGTIYVIRNSYARSHNVGLDKLSRAGAVVGTFRPCQPDN